MIKQCGLIWWFPVWSLEEPHQQHIATGSMNLRRNVVKTGSGIKHSEMLKETATRGGTEEGRHF